MKVDEATVGRLTAQVDTMERSTDAEVVVVLAGRSGPYREVSQQAALVPTLAFAVLALVAPWAVPWGWFLVELVVVGLVSERVLRHPAVVRRLLSAARREAEVTRAARAAFVEEAVHGTPHRTGVLVYVSALEDEVVLVPDLGVEGLVPGGELGFVRATFRREGLDAGLDALGRVLAARIPHTANSDATNLPNAPRIRP